MKIHRIKEKQKKTPCNGNVPLLQRGVARCYIARLNPSSSVASKFEKETGSQVTPVLGVPSSLFYFIVSRCVHEAFEHHVGGDGGVLSVSWVKSGKVELCV